MEGIVRALLSLHLGRSRGKKEVKIAKLCPTLCDPMDYIVHGIFQVRILEWVAVPFSRRSPQPRDQTRISCTADSLPAEPQAKPKNIGVGSLSLFQRIFLTQELNWDLWHCGWILYKLSYQGSPIGKIMYTLLWIHVWLSPFAVHLKLP